MIDDADFLFLTIVYCSILIQIIIIIDLTTLRMGESPDGRSVFQIQRISQSTTNENFLC